VKQGGGPGFVTRFAPSPTGYLHLGHAFSALAAFTTARQAGGRFLLRIEDIDEGRCRAEYEAALLEDLAWLGLAWETPVRRQSEHLADYRGALSVLQARGLVYRCFRTRREIAGDIGRAPHEAVPAFAGGPLAAGEETLRLALGDAYAWRLDLAAAQSAVAGFGKLSFMEEGRGPQGETGLIAADPARGGDVILARKDLGVAYHLAVVVDDALQGVTHVIRGADLFEATHTQRLIQTLLGLPVPAYRHHPLILRPDGTRLAKRDRADTLRAMRQRGVSAEAVRAQLGF
jgi:glutamyl-Q tRNA(Asp) synthetase